LYHKFGISIAGVMGQAATEEKKLR